MNFLNLFNSQKNTIKNANNNVEKNSNNYFAEYPENFFTNDFSNEIKDEKNYKMQENYIERNNYNENYLKNCNQNSNNFSCNKTNNNLTEIPNQNRLLGNNIFGNLTIQSLLPLLIGGKSNILDAITNTNPQLASVMNILNSKNKQNKTTAQKNDTSFDMSNFVKVSDYFKK